MITNVLKTLGSLRATLVAAAGIPFLIAASAFAQNDLNSAPAAGEATGGSGGVRGVRGGDLEGDRVAGVRPG